MEFLCEGLGCNGVGCLAKSFRPPRCSSRPVIVRRIIGSARYAAGVDGGVIRSGEEIRVGDANFTDYTKIAEKTEFDEKWSSSHTRHCKQSSSSGVRNF